MVLRERRENLELARELIEAGQIRTLIDRVYPLTQRRRSAPLRGGRRTQGPSRPERREFVTAIHMSAPVDRSLQLFEARQRGHVRHEDASSEASSAEIVLVSTATLPCAVSYLRLRSSYDPWLTQPVRANNTAMV